MLRIAATPECRVLLPAELVHVLDKFAVFNPLLCIADIHFFWDKYLRANSRTQHFQIVHCLPTVEMVTEEELCMLQELLLNLIEAFRWQQR